jgi:hypothetical protein
LLRFGAMLGRVPFSAFPSSSFRSSSFISSFVAARAAVVCGVVAFVTLVSTSMSVYPGGTSWNRHARGHDFWRNYLCDLERRTTWSGAANPVGSVLAQIAMTLIAASFLPLFWSLPRFFPSRRRLGRAVRALGAVTALLAPSIVLLPGDRAGALHGYAVLAVALPGLAATLLSVWGLCADRAAPRSLAWIGVATLASAAIDVALFVPVVLHPGSGHVAIAVLERIASMLLLTWMLAAAFCEPRQVSGGARAEAAVRRAAPTRRRRRRSRGRGTASAPFGVP